MQPAPPPPAAPHPARVQVSVSKKPLYFYVNLAKRFLQEHGEVQMSALGLAISTLVTAVEILKSGNWAVETSIVTGLDTGGDGGRERPAQKPSMSLILTELSKDPADARLGMLLIR
ncbi:hypothetical protein WJX81_006984 [Elliptochloris bilobata]|uniref:DNA/RNA-binding protein Alba-like domain-containing protein n=1 Tax=Elliptochloris bilobata TaxID=381761 RepID=A0AAW1Q973_9CHLO